MSKLQKIGFNYLGYGGLPTYEIIDDARKGYLCVHYNQTPSEYPQEVKFIAFTQVIDLVTEGLEPKQGAANPPKTEEANT